jgi:myo-inositol-1(or 4)-monophosphatase
LSLQELLRTAREAAAAGAAVVREGDRRRDFTVTTKARSDYVTEIDVASERAIREVILARHPGHRILGEEGGASAGGEEWRWVVDPLDGTTNFIRGIPFFAVSVGLERHGVPVAGVIVDPVRDVEWWGARGEGAFVNGTPLRVSARSSAAESLVLTGIPFRTLDRLELYLPGLQRVALATAGVRRMGSAALDLASIAGGHAEAFWEYGLGRWDLCAGVVLIEEAGGRVTDLHGGAGHLETGDVLATNGLVHDAMMSCVRCD